MWLSRMSDLSVLHSSKPSIKETMISVKRGYSRISKYIGKTGRLISNIDKTRIFSMSFYLWGISIIYDSTNYLEKKLEISNIHKLTSSKFSMDKFFRIMELSWAAFI